jgi:hypothetical protein
VTKRCRKCGEEKPSPAFRSNPRCRDGLSSWCAECHNEATRQWRSRKWEAEEAEAWARQQAESERLRRYEAQRRARAAEFQAERARHEQRLNPDAPGASTAADPAVSLARRTP